MFDRNSDYALNKKDPDAIVNCTPFVRQYDILDNKWGALLCQKGYQANDTHQNSKSWYAIQPEVI